jgi:hypothetical protein
MKHFYTQYCDIEIKRILGNFWQEVSIDIPSHGLHYTQHKVCCVCLKSLPWFVIETHGSEISNIALNFVRENVSRDMGLS